MKFGELELNKSATFDVALVKIDEMSTSTGEAYCTCYITDGEETVAAKVWNTKKKDIEELEETVVTATISCSIYKDKKQYKIINMISPDHEVSVDDFIRTAPVAAEQMYEDILQMVDEESVYGKIVHHIFELYKTPILTAAGGKKIHHAYKSGLIYHMYRMVKAAEALSAIYPVNRDLLIAGTVLHDIGKLSEMSTNVFGQAEYTPEGLRLSHIVIGIKLLDFACARLKVYETEERCALEAMIASHHGSPDKGALTKPCFYEAMILHHLDMIDSRADIYEEVYKKVGKGEVSEYIFGLDNVKVVRPNL